MGAAPHPPHFLFIKSTSTINQETDIVYMRYWCLDNKRRREVSVLWNQKRSTYGYLSLNRIYLTNFLYLVCCFFSIQKRKKNLQQLPTYTMITSSIILQLVSRKNLIQTLSKISRKSRPTHMNVVIVNVSAKNFKDFTCWI